MNLFNKKRFDMPVLYYKIFLIFILLAQLYPLFFGIGNIITHICHIIVGVYVIFRYYMLIRVKKMAVSLSMSLTEFLSLTKAENYKG